MTIHWKAVEKYCTQSTRYCAVFQFYPVCNFHYVLYFKCKFSMCLMAQSDVLEQEHF